MKKGIYITIEYILSTSKLYLNYKKGGPKYFEDIQFLLRGRKLSTLSTFWSSLCLPCLVLHYCSTLYINQTEQ